jgi:SAM-dependent methyltransferase
MTDRRPVPPGVDPERPSPARIYDYLLGGDDYFESDRLAAERLKSQIPEVVDTAWANRGFHQRAAIWIASHGVGQFLDIGCGLPTAGNTHEVVRRVRPGARVVYADNDPMVAAHGRELLREDDLAIAILADVRDPEAVLDNVGVRALIDFTRPVGLLMTALMHFIPDSDNPWGLVKHYLAALAKDSYLALSQRTFDLKPPQALQALAQVGERAAGGSHYRSKEEVRRFFESLELVPPYPGAPADVTWVGLWGCEDPAEADSEGSRWFYCGVGRKPD